MILNYDVDSLMNVPELKFMHPVIRGARLPIPSNDGVVLLRTIDEIIKKYVEGAIYTTEWDRHLYSFVPMVDLLWHELVRGCMMGAFLCCSHNGNDADLKLSVKNIVEKVQNDAFSIDTLIEALKTSFNNTTIGISDCTFSDPGGLCGLEKKLERRIGLDKPRKHIVMINSLHGFVHQDDSLPDLVQIPRNVTLIKAGRIGEITSLFDRRQNSCVLWKDRIIFQDYTTNFRTTGSDIVVPGSWYPNLGLSVSDEKMDYMNRCDTGDIIHVNRNNNKSTLEKELTVASDIGSLNNRNVVVIMTACQWTHDEHVISSGFQNANLAYDMPVISVINEIHRSTKRFEDIVSSRMIDTTQIIRLSNGSIHGPERGPMFMEATRTQGKILEKTREKWIPGGGVSASSSADGGPAMIACSAVILLGTVLASLVQR
jgi:hypothetical protein